MGTCSHGRGRYFPQNMLPKHGQYVTRTGLVTDVLLVLNHECRTISKSIDYYNIQIEVIR
jgi:hypothetical protein